MQNKGRGAAVKAPHAKITSNPTAACNIKQRFQFVLTLCMKCGPLAKTLAYYVDKLFSNFRTVAAHATIRPFNGEIRQRTSNFESLNEFFDYIFTV